MSLDSGSTPSAPAEEPAAFWARKTRQQRWLVNSAWWIESFLPLAFLATLAFTALTLAGRRAGWPPKVYALVGFLLAVATLAASYWQARRRFVSGAQARVQLEYALSLDARLTSAADGIGAWPATAAWKASPWRWNAPRLALLPTVCVALLGAAFLVRIPAHSKKIPLPTVLPPSLARVEDWLEKLSKSSQIEPKSLENIRAEAEQLGHQNQQDWYSHASLETADHLENQLESGLRSLEQNTTKIADALSAAANPNLSDAQAKALGGQLGAALNALEGNVPALNHELASKLSQIDPSKLRELDPSQLQELKRRLGESKGECQ
ncbi:MAG TPA: hypothetical protein VGH90_14025, partial [Chthoniobacteraceae bacterium]